MNFILRLIVLLVLSPGIAFGSKSVVEFGPRIQVKAIKTKTISKTNWEKNYLEFTALNFRKPAIEITSK